MHQAGKVSRDAEENEFLLFAWCIDDKILRVEGLLAG